MPSPRRRSADRTPKKATATSVCRRSPCSRHNAAPAGRPSTKPRKWARVCSCWIPRSTVSRVTGSWGSTAFRSSTHRPISSPASRRAATSGKSVAEVARERTSIPHGRSDDQAGVVAGERSDDPFVGELVQSARDRGRRTELRDDDDEVARRCDAPAELDEDRAQRLLWIGPARVARRVVPGSAEGVVCLLEAKLADVARNRRLCHDAANVGEGADQLELRADALARDDALDQAVPVRLPERAPRLHRESI